MKNPFLFAAFALCSLPQFTSAQCPVGEMEVFIHVTTDDYGYESYWQLLPSGNPCGTGTIFAGGNALVGCSGGGLSLQQPGGYGDNVMTIEGPWCLTAGGSYDIFSVDDYGDGQPTYDVFVDGLSIGQFNAPGATNVFTFSVQAPLSRDIGISELTTSLYSTVGDQVKVRGTLKNFGVDPVTDVELSYTIDGGLAVTTTLTGLNIPQYGTYEFEHSITWVPSSTGAFALDVSVGDVNNANDENLSNNDEASTLTVNDPTPNIIDQYLIGNPVMNEVANSNQDLLVPRDLDFHPDLSRNELWVINKDVESSGGSTVKFTDPGTLDMDFLWQRDANAWHFMSLPTGIAFGDNGDFSTCPGVFDANHNGGDPFTGISLWSSDPNIYAQNIFGPLGSHLDMLHVTPNSQGIASERWNRYWVVDGYNGDVVMHDFKGDHGPGNDYHGNAIIRRYADFTITHDPADHIVSHCVLDPNSNWLYVVDFGGQRVMRLDITSGTVSGPGSYGPWETYVEYSQMSGTTWEEVISTGLVQPAGIEVIGNRLLVSDHSNGDIVIYDISGTPVVEMGRIHTNNAGIMGLKVGPDGHIWYVNATLHQLVRVDPDDNVAVNELSEPTLAVHPNPTTGILYFPVNAGKGNEPVVVSDATGRIVAVKSFQEVAQGMDLSALAPGSYSVRIGQKEQRVVIAR